METETRHAAGIVVCRDAGGGVRVLLLRNAMHGTWGFPKGHRDAGEDDETCALRECREETGLLPAVLDPGFRMTVGHQVRGPDRDHRKLVTYFLAKVATDVSVKISPEHDGLLWADEKEALATLRHENLRDVLRAALAALGADSR